MTISRAVGGPDLRIRGLPRFFLRLSAFEFRETVGVSAVLLELEKQDTRPSN
jgi:hypothetical protein